MWLIKMQFSMHTTSNNQGVGTVLELPGIDTRVAEVGSLSSGAKIVIKTFVKRVFTIFATNVSFLRVIANLQI